MKKNTKNIQNIIVINNIGSFSILRKFFLLLISFLNFSFNHILFFRSFNICFNCKLIYKSFLFFPAQSKSYSINLVFSIAFASSGFVALTFVKNWNDPTVLPIFCTSAVITQSMNFLAAASLEHF